VVAPVLLPNGAQLSTVANASGESESITSFGQLPSCLKWIGRDDTLTHIREIHLKKEKEKRRWRDSSCPDEIML
jgi:hypothetical protein